MSAAFDTMVHSFLLEDLETILVKDETLELMKNYIEGRTYCVQIGRVKSRTQTLSRGIPLYHRVGCLVLFCFAYAIELLYIPKRHGVLFTLFADGT